MTRGDQIAVVQAAVSAERLAVDLDAILDKIDQADNQLLDWRVEAGRLLTEARKAFPQRGPKSGAWGEYVRARRLNQVSAARYMRLYSFVTEHPELRGEPVHVIYERMGEVSAGWMRESSSAERLNAAPQQNDAPPSYTPRPGDRVRWKPEGQKGTGHTATVLRSEAGCWLIEVDRKGKPKEEALVGPEELTLVSRPEPPPAELPAYTGPSPAQRLTLFPEEVPAQALADKPLPPKPERRSAPGAQTIVTDVPAEEEATCPTPPAPAPASTPATAPSTATGVAATCSPATSPATSIPVSAPATTPTPTPTGTPSTGDLLGEIAAALGCAADLPEILQTIESIKEENDNLTDSDRLLAEALTEVSAERDELQAAARRGYEQGEREALERVASWVAVDVPEGATTEQLDTEIAAAIEELRQDLALERQPRACAECEIKSAKLVEHERTIDRLRRQLERQAPPAEREAVLAGVLEGGEREEETVANNAPFRPGDALLLQIKGKDGLRAVPAIFSHAQGEMCIVWRRPSAPGKEGGWDPAWPESLSPDTEARDRAADLRQLLAAGPASAARPAIERALEELGGAPRVELDAPPVDQKKKRRAGR